MAESELDRVKRLLAAEIPQDGELLGVIERELRRHAWDNQTGCRTCRFVGSHVGTAEAWRYHVANAVLDALSHALFGEEK